MALVRGYCILEGPPRLVAPFGRLWKRCSFPLASLMTDFLEAVLREMASSVPVALLCQSSSPHTSQLPRSQTRRLWLSLLAKRSRQRYDGLCGSAAGPPTIPNGTSAHPPSSFLDTQGPSSSVTKATQWQGMCGFRRVGSLTGFRLLSVE